MIEKVNISTMDEEVFEDPDNFFEDENEEDVQRASIHRLSIIYKKKKYFL